MEFFAIADLGAAPEGLQNITVRELDHYCSDINEIISVENENCATVYCVWGEFIIHRQVINGGVRFSMPGCPNSMAWTVTTGFEPEPDRVVIHGTINRTGHDPDFIESIEDFLESWKEGLEKKGIVDGPGPGYAGST